MTTASTIRSFKSTSTVALVVLCVVRGLVRLAPIVFGGLLVLSGLDRWVELASWGRQVLWLIVFGGGAIAFVSGFLPFSLFSTGQRSIQLSRRSSALREDDFRIAMEFSRASASSGTSDELRAAFIESIGSSLRKCRPWWCFPSWRWKAPTAAAVMIVLTTVSARAFFPALFPLETRTLFPFWSYGVERALRIEPGDADVPFGKDAIIRLKLNEPSSTRPVLMVKTGETWLEMQPDTELSDTFTYTIKNVVMPLSYRVGWRREWSRRFKLSPVSPISIKRFQIELQPPAYTGKAAVVQSSPELTGLAGSSVRMTVETDRPLDKISLLLSDNREVVAQNISGALADFQFTLDKRGSYDFTMKESLGPALQSESSYPIHVVDDQAPTITLLSPDQDVVIGEKEKLPITFDVRDDVGLGEVNLEWQVPQGKNGGFRLKEFNASDESAIATVPWDLASQSFPPGLAVRFRLEVVDRNRVTGPGRAFSEWRLLEIRSFELEHAAIEKTLENWRDKAVETLAQINTLKKKAEAENADLPALSPELNKALQNMERLESILKQTVSKMEQDPMADYGVWLEHKEMRENLNALNQHEAKAAQSAFQTQNKPSASSNLEAISNELERMTALSEDLSKSQKARDVTQAGENLEQIGQDLMKALENDQDSDIAKKVAQLLDEAQKNLAEMARALQQMPEELPDDFVNQEALKNIEIGKSQDIMSQIADAMKSGDTKRALELAQKFLEAAKSMRERLSKAHDSFLKSHSAEEIAKKISEQQKALQKISDEQRQLLAETQKLASKQLDAVMQEQENLLKKLAERQEKLVSETRTLANDNMGTHAVMAFAAGQVKPMSDVATEFRSKRVDKAPDLLTSVVSQLTLVQSELMRSSAPASLAGSVARIRDEESQILAQLKTPPPPPNANAEDQSAYDELNKRQAGLREKTQALKQQLQILSRKTASLGSSLMQSLSAAGGEMKSASGQLGSKNGVVAQRHEENALDDLMQGQEQLSQAQAAMSDMAMEQGGGQEGGQGQPGGRGPGGPKVILRNGSGGTSGTHVGKVKLPSADDYRPPKVFREDLMESLKENYPKIYEEIIHKYYKRLAE